MCIRDRALPQWNFLWTTNWTDTAAWTAGLCLFLIPIIAALLTYLSTKITTKMNPQPEGSSNGMQGLNIIMPIVTLWFAFVMPAALGLDVYKRQVQRLAPALFRAWPAPPPPEYFESLRETWNIPPQITASILYIKNIQTVKENDRSLC